LHAENFFIWQLARPHCHPSRASPLPKAIRRGLSQ
jgi:hypothetical protein